ARRVDDRAPPGARGARAREAERALIVGDHARAAARRAGARRGPRLGPRAVAHRADGVADDVDRRGHAAHGLVERQVQLGLEVGAPLRARPARRAVATTAEEVAEEVADVAEVVDAERAAPAAGEAGGHGAHAADLVVLLALVGVTED